MGIYELRQKYGRTKKAGQAVNAAIRAEIPGGGRLLELTHRVRKRLPELPENVKSELTPIFEHLLQIRQEMLNAVAEKYQLATFIGEHYEDSNCETVGWPSADAGERTPDETINDSSFGGGNEGVGNCRF